MQNWFVIGAFFVCDSVASEIKSMIEGLRSKFEKERYIWNQWIPSLECASIRHVCLGLFLFIFLHFTVLKECIVLLLPGKVLPRRFQRVPKRFVDDDNGLWLTLINDSLVGREIRVGQNLFN